MNKKKLNTPPTSPVDELISSYKKDLDFHTRLGNTDYVRCITKFLQDLKALKQTPVASEDSQPKEVERCKKCGLIITACMCNMKYMDFRL
jgi:hypothetical protein